MDEKDNIEFLRVLYFDILNGYSYHENKNFYVRHLSDIENSQVIQKKFYFIEKYKKDGIPTFNEKLKEIIDNNIWTLKLEDDIVSLKYQISDNEKNLKTIIQYQRPLIEQVIESKKKELSKLLLERKNHLGKTCEDFAIRESENYFIYLCLYKDLNLKEKLFEKYDDFEQLEESEIEKLSDIIEKELEFFKEEYISKIAVMPFFLNILSYCKDNIYNFYNKSVISLSPYQILLYSLGTRNLNILNQADGSPPEMFGDTKIEDVIKWYDQNFSIIQSKNNPNQQMGITKRSTDVITKRY